MVSQKNAPLRLLIITLITILCIFALSSCDINIDDIKDVRLTYDEAGIFVRPDETCEVLRKHINVSVYFKDGTRLEITDYTISGELKNGFCDITVDYHGISRTIKMYINITEMDGSEDGVHVHNMSRWSTDTATCLVNGRSTRKCLICGLNESRVTVSLGHKLENGKCERCSKGASEGLVLDYNVKTKEARVVRIGDCTDTDIVIPAEYEGYPVTKIAERAFADQSQITSVTIPYGVKTIEMEAFLNCTGLKSISFPDSVTLVDEMAFFRCTSLREVEFSNNLTTISPFCFGECDFRTLYIPKSVKTVANNAFQNCHKLAVLVFEDGVERIESLSFFRCKTLASITLPKSIKYIDTSAFQASPAREIVNNSDIKIIPGAGIGMDAYEVHSGENRLINRNNLLFYHHEQSDTYRLVSHVGYDTDIVLPDNIRGSSYEIDSEAFSFRSDITSVTFSNGVTGVGFKAFWECRNIKSLYIPSSVTWLGECAFGGMAGLESFILEANIDHIPAGLLYLNGIINEVKLPENYTSIGESAFTACVFDITLPNTLKRIDNWAFSNSNIINMTIPSSVEHFGDDVFQLNEHIENLKMECKIPAISNFGFKTFSSIPLTPGGVKPMCSSVTEYQGGYYFKVNDNPYAILLTTKSPSLINGDFEVFTIHKDTVSIDVNALDLLDKTTAFLVEEGNSIFTTKNGILYTKEGVCVCYPGLKTETAITVSPTDTQVDASKQNSFIQSFELEGESSHFMVIDGVLYSADGKTLVAYPRGRADESFTVPDGVTTIGERAFYQCAYLKNITIPASVKVISPYAFYESKLLQSVIFAENSSLEVIEEYAFYQMLYLKYDLHLKITLPRSLKRIGQYAFYQTATEITFEAESQLERLENYWIGTLIGSLTIPKSVTRIDYIPYAYSEQKITFEKTDGWYYVLGNMVPVRLDVTDLRRVQEIVNTYTYGYIENR